MNKILLAGGFGGDFGWEVCAWIPALRHLAQNYDKVVIACNYEHRYLYDDFTDIFEDYRNIKGRGDMWYLSRFPTVKPKPPKKLIKKYPGCDVVIPNKYMCTKAPRKFFRYGRDIDEKSYDIIIHARAEDKYGQHKLNYNPVKYKKMLKTLRLEKKISACSVGTKAYHIDSTNDQRNMFLEYICTRLRKAKVCVGTSSGLMHLAHLCGCPIVVITDNKYQKGIKATNRVRYELLWRPFRDVPVTILDKWGWHPPVERVIEAVRKYL